MQETQETQETLRARDCLLVFGLALAPPTGLALPLVSYGRSNLVMTLVALGILISIARATPGGKAARA